MAANGSSLVISLIPPQYIHDVWMQVAPLLERALDRAPGRFGAGDMFMLLSRGEYQLWAVFENEVIVASFTTRLYQTPQSKVCCIEWVGGARLHEWIDNVVLIVESFARDNGCQKVEGHGRKGWHKAAVKHGWHELATTWEHDL